MVCNTQNSHKEGVWFLFGLGKYPKHLRQQAKHEFIWRDLHSPSHFGLLLNLSFVCFIYSQRQTPPFHSTTLSSWLTCIFFTCVCVLVSSKLMQLWEFSVVGVFKNIFLLAELETIWNAAMLACALWGIGGGIDVCQMEKDKTGVMICCNHAAKPTTVNYCCNNLLPVAKGTNQAFLCLLDISVFERELSLQPLVLSDC